LPFRVSVAGCLTAGRPRSSSSLLKMAWCVGGLAAGAWQSDAVYGVSRRPYASCALLSEPALFQCRHGGSRHAASPADSLARSPRRMRGRYESYLCPARRIPPGRPLALRLIWGSVEASFRSSASYFCFNCTCSRCSFWTPLVTVRLGWMLPVLGGFLGYRSSGMPRALSRVVWSIDAAILSLHSHATVFSIRRDVRFGGGGPAVDAFRGIH
jgi:hypothetical protein